MYMYVYIYKSCSNNNMEILWCGVLKRAFARLVIFLVLVRKCCSKTWCIVFPCYRGILFAGGPLRTYYILNTIIYLSNMLVAGEYCRKYNPNS